MNYGNDDDFYMVLPSNAAPQRHPDNNASDFTVTWDNPIELDTSSNWKVALTEINYTYTPSTLNQSYAIRYRKYFEIFTITSFKLRYLPNGEPMQMLDVVNPTDATIRCFLNKDGALVIECSKPFRVKNKFILKDVFGFQNDAAEPQGIDVWQLVSQKPLNSNPEEDIERTLGNFELKIFHYVDQTHEFRFSNVHAWGSSTEFARFISDQCKGIFKTFKLNKSKKFEFSLDPLVLEVRFLNGLNFVFGFELTSFNQEVDFDKVLLDNRAYLPSTTFSAQHLPQLRRGITNMYIYGSICRPIHVGHVLVPLLKNMYLDTSRDELFGHVRNYVVHNLMYVPVSSTSFSSIEINIRNDIGQIVWFPDGSITCLTLHFKRTSSINR